MGEVQICNLALMKVGNLSITSLEDATKEGRACKLLYPLVRDELMASHPWNFAMSRADIGAALLATPAFQWDYAYTVPGDCLRVWEFYGSTAEWVVENGTFLTNESEEIYIRYIKLITDSSKFSPSFISCLATKLAAELDGKLSDGKKRASFLQELYSRLLPDAYSLNAVEGNPPIHTDMQSLDKGNFSWQTEGR
jgi:hypothetical protein